jgi:two-component system nitrogen regulation response regulator NtrX
MRNTLPDGSLAPFIAVDSATIQSSTAESILFGHEKGAFTGAEKAVKGLFEEAHGGSVYFDEIGNMPLDIQAKLLRVLQEKEVVRMGSSKVIQLDFRVICATNRDLGKMVAENLFKEDLLQRLNVLPIEIPPLRERVEDLPLLIDHFARRLSARGERTRALAFTGDAIEILKAYAWPGNIREVSSLVSYVSTMVEGDEVDVADLPPKYRDSGRKKMASSSADTTSSFYERVAGFEKSILTEAFEKQGGPQAANVSKLALALGMDRSHLYSKLKEYEIYSPKAKPQA